MKVYSIYPTLLDSYDWYKTRGTTQAEKELFAKLNKVPFTPTPEMKRGSAFEELVNNIVKDGPTLVEQDGATWNVTVGEFTFGLEEQRLAEKIATDLKTDGPLQMQKYVQTSFMLDENTQVRIYGFVDYIGATRIWDLKTCRYYNPGKYGLKWQRAAYMACLPQLKQFTFIATDFAEVYEETYTDAQVDQFKAKLREFINFIESRRAEINNPRLFK